MVPSLIVHVGDCQWPYYTTSMYTVAIISSDTRAANNSRYVLSAYKNKQIPDAKFIVLSDNKKAAIFEAATSLSIPSYYADTTGNDSGETMRDILLEQNVDVVMLLGYTKKIKAPMLDAFPNRILNFHSAPIPRFGGKGLGGINAQVAVLEAGAEYTGPVIHIVDEEYDHGPILAHWPIKVRPDDTPESLNARCNAAGRKLYVQEINNFIYRLRHPEDFR